MTTIENPAVREAINQAKTRMTKALEDTRHELAGIRTGRASVSMLDGIRVDYYGTPTALNQVATLGVPEPNLVTVQPWDTTLLSAIDKAIRSSDLGLNPMSDGKLLRIPVPPLTEERRKDLVKHLHKVLENHRTAIRNIRRDSNDGLKKSLKEKEISEDDEKRGLEEIQKITDDFISKLDAQGQKQRARSDGNQVVTCARRSRRFHQIDDGARFALSFRSGGFWQRGSLPCGRMILWK